MYSDVPFRVIIPDETILGPINEETPREYFALVSLFAIPGPVPSVVVAAI